MSLIDRAPDSDPHWWFNYGQMVLCRFSKGLMPKDMERREGMQAVREVLREAVADGGIREDFLVQALLADLDAFVAQREDPAGREQRAREMRAHMQRVIDDPQVRARWRQSMASVDAKYGEWTDEQFEQHAKRALESSPLTNPLSAEDAAEAWLASAHWSEVRTQCLPRGAIDRWGRLNLAQAHDGGREQDRD